MDLSSPESRWIHGGGMEFVTSQLRVAMERDLVHDMDSLSRVLTVFENDAAMEQAPFHLEHVPPTFQDCPS